MSILAMVIVKTFEPVRFVAVTLGLWAVWNVFEPGRRLIPSLIILAGVSLLMVFLLAQTLVLLPRMDIEVVAIRFASGFVACAIHAYIILGAAWLFSQGRSR